MLTAADQSALWLTLQLAITTTLVLLALGTPVAWWLAHSRWRWRFVIETLIALPLVLPPTVLGFYLLLALGPQGWLGQLLSAVGSRPLAFTFQGLLLGSVIYSLPFVVQPLQDTFQSIGRRPLEVAASLRMSPWQSFRKVIVPMARAGFITAASLGFAHTIGEFGVVLMLGGNIPGETRVLSIAIYDHVESLEYSNAHWLAGGLLLLSFCLLLVVYSARSRLRFWRS
jgi:molybdate transport system permease protein